MIKITNGTRTTMCTKGAFENWYEPMGWKIADMNEVEAVNETLPEEKDIEPENASEPPEETLEDEEVEPEEEVEVEIPLSEMKLADLKEYAEEHGIDISAAKTKHDIRAIIKAEMEE